MTHEQFPATTILGYPRIGPNRELKRALESFWAGRSSADDLQGAAANLRSERNARLQELQGNVPYGIPGDFTFYDQVWQVASHIGAIPARFAHLRNEAGALDLAGHFTVARGEGELAPLEMTKWFDSNYHYLVPEIGPDTEFALVERAVVRYFEEAVAAGVTTRPVLVGPVTFLLLSKPTEDAPADFQPLDRLDDVVAIYGQLLAEFGKAGAAWVQLDEPALVSDTWDTPRDEVLAATARAYETLIAGSKTGPAIFVAAPYNTLGDGLGVLAEAGVPAIGLDLVRGELPTGEQLANVRDTTLVAGVVDGHNIWATDLAKAHAKVEALRELAGPSNRVTVATSTSLIHVPHTVSVETELSEQLRSWLAFADEKVGEVAAIAAGPQGAGAEFERSAAVVADRAAAAGVHVEAVRKRTAALESQDFSRVPYVQRWEVQEERFGLPDLPTTTIGSFPQTAELRQARALLRKGDLAAEDYEQAMRDEIASVVKLQEELGLDVLVHGEAERNDMVQYFAENLDGFSVTHHGWVQSYGSRCTRPSILWGDVSRPAPITVEWSSYAQSLTELPLKGMLTGPVTILAWSFVRDDEPWGEVANQVALALRDEIADLEAAGIGIIQVDEPALRELLPLRADQQQAYLDWSVNSFRLATAGVDPATQIHTHLCYSEFGEVMGAIDGLDADVTSIEAARSKMEILPAVAQSGFGRGIGPGVYDIHSPRVPSVAEITELLQAARASIGDRKLWVNPDCGLKTRNYPETIESLTNLVTATRNVRS